MITRQLLILYFLYCIAAGTVPTVTGIVICVLVMCGLLLFELTILIPFTDKLLQKAKILEAQEEIKRVLKKDE